MSKFLILFCDKNLIQLIPLNDIGYDSLPTIK